ncbi:MAG: hypothetical protein JJE55_15705 [Flavobacteriaceae bacterium]|nr:hypothetical protein [Flavobacteriaceae bacterium]
MDTTKVVSLTLIGIIAMAIALTVIQFLIRKEKLKSEKEGKINLSYGILFSTWIIAITILNLKSISILSEFIDIISKTTSSNPTIEILKTSILFIGLTNVWLIVLYFITKAFSLIFIGKKNNLYEIENNNYPYFIMKGILFISFIYLLLPVFEIILREFFPAIEIPFYR